MPVRPLFPGEGNESGSSVNSVNGEQGDVIITAQDLSAQPASSVLTDIAAVTMPNNSFIHTDGSGHFSPSLCMPAGLAWLSYNTVDQQKDHLALAEVASSGDYNDLINKPTSMIVPTKTSELTNDSGFITIDSVPTQVNSDWNSVSGKSQILNKPVLFSGSYSDLSSKPTTFTPSTHTHSIADVTGLQTSLDNKIAIGASIPYSSLTGAPSIPSAQVNSDWTSVSGVSQVLNKPVLATVATSGSYVDLTNKPTIPTVNYPVTSVNTKTGALVLSSTDVGAAASVHTHSVSDVTGLQAALDGKFTIPTGTISQYLRGNGTLATLPTAVSSFTNDSGYLTSVSSAQVTTALGFTPYNATNPGAYVSQSGARTAISLTTSGSGSATYNSATGVLNVPTSSNPVQASATRSLNSAFQISATRNALVMYSVQITVSASISGGQNGDVVLEIASDSGFTANVQTVAVSGLGQTYTLAIALAGVQPQTTVVSGFVPIGYYARLRTVNNTGTPAFAYRFGQEVLM